MKLVVVLLVVLFGLWLWRQGRQAERNDRDERDERKAAAPRPKPQVALPAEMVRCSVCGLHLPAADALTTGKGSFCSPEHQRQATHTETG